MHYAMPNFLVVVKQWDGRPQNFFARGAMLGIIVPTFFCYVQITIPL